MNDTQTQPSAVSRRQFLTTSALVGGCAALAASCRRADDLSARAASGELSPDEFYELAQAENILYTTCMNCNTGCGIKAKIVDGVMIKVDGNPYSPWTMTPHLRYHHSPADPEIAKLDGAICPKGQAGIQTLYDPYRIRRVLKRTGRRGEGKWTSIPFEQAIAEVVEGGRLFADVPGEEAREVEGLAGICALRDPGVMALLRADAGKITAGEMTVTEFRQKHRNHLDKLIDPDHPDLGPRNNQLVFNWGRMKAGRSQFVQRFISDSFGTVNRIGHTTVCQGSLYFACRAMSEQYVNGQWTGGRKFYWQADLKNAEFVIFVGSNAFEGGYGPPLRTPKITNGLTERRFKFAVVDPRMGKLGGMAWKWLPAKPASETGLALALIRWIIENRRYDQAYLSAANKAAADAVGEPNWSNSSWLVKMEADGPGDLLRVGDLPAETRPEGDPDRFVVLREGRIQAVDANDPINPVVGDLLVDTTLGGIPVKSSLQLLYESACEHSLAGWAEICGIRVRDIVDLAREFTSHGKKASADIHRGVSQHTNGYLATAAWMSLNLLIGNIGWKGGMIEASTYNATGTGSGQPFPVNNLHPGKLGPFGIPIIRDRVEYEKSTLFNGYPSRRPWYPIADSIYQEVIPSAGDGYPYTIKALILYMGAPNYALPAGNELNAILSDTAKIPLFIANDITIGATSAYADYIFPDGTFYERWEFHGSHGSVAQKVQPVRTPVVTPLVDTCTVFGEEMPITLESMMMAMAEKMGLSGFGPDGFGGGMPLTHPDHYYLKMVANVAADGTPVPDADAREEEVFRKSRRHLAGHTFEEKRWKESVGEEWWKKVIYVLNRGGRYQDYPDTYRGELLTNAYARLINLYCEKTARFRNSMTGQRYDGIARHYPVLDSLGRELADTESDYPLLLSTYRQSVQTKTRTNSAYWLLAVTPENAILMNRLTARASGLKTGDEVVIESATNPDGVWDLGGLGKRRVAGKIKVVEGMRPGVVTFSLGFGQWGNGATDMRVDGDLLRRDDRRGRGINANAVMRVDPFLKNTALSDPIGASVSFYDTRVRLRKLG
ncbi:MAG: twin-arginine translocation signal domain-containing protein [Puniceicoccaceae bacterium]|nr:MAG: twin-arginine translocation signal domain-containing protein [Puniceicoccaceae bacterium]